MVVVLPASMCAMMPTLRVAAVVAREPAHAALVHRRRRLEAGVAVGAHLEVDVDAELGRVVRERRRGRYKVRKPLARACRAGRLCVESLQHHLQVVTTDARRHAPESVGKGAPAGTRGARGHVGEDGGDRVYIRGSRAAADLARQARDASETADALRV